MKYIILLLALGIIGCGEDKNDGFGADGNPINLTEQQIYTLETHYLFRLNGHDVWLWGVSDAFGRANEEASAQFSDFQPNIACGIRMIVKKVGLTLNDYTIKIGASGWIYPECGELRGNYTMTLTGAKTADITWVSQDDETF